MNKRHLALLIGIVLIAACLRFYKLATLPPSLEWDEVATGYDANSILRTGRDQFGNFLPLTLRSIDDYKPPVYTYLTAGSIAIFGWNDFAVRFPAAFIGVLAIISTYALTTKLFQNSRLGLLAALFLAISPWHINFSRLALETNSTIFFTTAGVWAFLKGTKNGKWFILSALLFGIDLYLYHNARIFIPLLGLVLLTIYRPQIIEQKKSFIIAAIILSIFVIRLIPIMTSIEGQMRLRGTSIFTEAVPLDTTAKKDMYEGWRSQDITTGNSLFSKFHSEKLMFALIMLQNYLSHYNPTFWLFTSDTPRHHLPESGILYFVDLPFIYIGLYYLFRQKDKKIPIILFSWFLFTPISAIVTRDVPHALRTAIFMPTFQIFIALAITSIWNKLKINWHRVLFAAFLIIGYGLNFTYFVHHYFTHYAKDTSEYWQYGRDEAIQFAESIKDNYDQILVSPSLDQPHVFFLYYLKYDPQKYLAEGGTVSGGWAETRNKIGKYQFRPFNYTQEQDSRTLFIGTAKDFPPSTNPLKKVFYLNGTEAVWIVE